MIEVVICPLCNSEIHRHVAGRVETKIRLPSRTEHAGNVMAMLSEAAQLERQQELAACEQACVAHYGARHRLRLALWRRFGWTWLMRWPTRASSRAHLVNQQEFDPLQFMDQ